VHLGVYGVDADDPLLVVVKVGLKATDGLAAWMSPRRATDVA
jgi:hypothetical protein